MRTVIPCTEIVSVVKRNAPANVTFRPPGLVTTTSTDPLSWSGAIASIVEWLLERMRAATPPILTVAPALNPAPFRPSASLTISELRAALPGSSAMEPGRRGERSRMAAGVAFSKREAILLASAVATIVVTLAAFAGR
jgi:hypothetical protein